MKNILNGKQNKKVIFTILLIFLGMISIDFSTAQTIKEIKPLPTIDKEFLIVAHIVTADSSLFEKNQKNITLLIEEMNVVFEPIKASFSICEFRMIDHERYASIDEKSRKEMVEKHQKLKRINIFFINDFIDSPSAAGLAQLNGVSNQATGSALFIAKTGLNVGTLAHEMGHYFGLKHTFGGDGKELVDGSNCLTTADGICDTPADPYVEESGIKYLDDNCFFIDDAKDANGQYYSPLTGNIMSYYGCKQGFFTNGQYIKMVETYKQPYNPSTVNTFVW